jgi:predicted GIY-YIG superfamily endonuclease
MEKKVSLYVLECEHKKYFIGKTKKPLTERIKEYFIDNKVEWTSQHKPIKCIDVIYNVNKEEEDIYTKEYMKVYGIINVRGGSYTDVVLPEYKIKSLLEEFNNSGEICYICNEKGHFIKECSVYSSKQNRCYRCYRQGHYINDCYVTTREDGSRINDYKVDVLDYKK